jgi:predicted NBD/HSP70 family sugar kinase
MTTLGLDLSESTIRGVIVDRDGEVIARAEQIAATDIGRAVRDVNHRLHAAARGALDAVGLATAFPGAPASELVAAASEALPDTEPVAVSAGSAAALAETWCGVARGLQNVVSFSIGEHVTAGLVLDGKVWTGVNGFAGSVSWLALNPVEREDYRRLGALEAEVAAAGIVRRLVWRVKSGDRSAVAEKVGGDLTRLTADLVFRAAREGDGVCISVMRDTAKYVGMAVSNLATVVDPEAVVLGGSLAAMGDMLRDAIVLECSRRLNPPQGDRLRILLSTLGTEAVAIGAARAAALRPA